VNWIGGVGVGLAPGTNKHWLRRVSGRRAGGLDNGRTDRQADGQVNRQKKNKNRERTEVGRE